MIKANENGTGVTLKMSKTQLVHNVEVEGGFIGAILPFLATAAKFLLPSLAQGALAGVGSAAASKVIDKISGSGGVIYIRRGDRNAKIVQQGEGLYLKPWRGSGLDGRGDGLYMKTGKGFVDGAGLILGPNSPFSNIPILGWLL